MFHCHNLILVITQHQYSHSTAWQEVHSFLFLIGNFQFLGWKLCFQIRQAHLLQTWNTSSSIVLPTQAVMNWQQLACHLECIKGANPMRKSHNSKSYFCLAINWYTFLAAYCSNQSWEIAHLADHRFTLTQKAHTHSWKIARNDTLSCM